MIPKNKDIQNDYQSTIKYKGNRNTLQICFYFKYSSSVAYDLYQEPSIASYGVINLLISN